MRQFAGIYINRSDNSKYMGFFITKTVKGHEYVYYAKNKRVGGKVVREVERYLGPALKIDKVMKGLLEEHTSDTKPAKPDDAYPFQFGLPVATYTMLRRVKVAEAVDKVLPRKAHDGPTLGQLIEIAVINRASDPSSRSATPDWFNEETSLPHIYGFTLSPYFSQNLWNNLNDLTSDQVRQIENIIYERIVEVFDPELDILLFDPTNFYTFIDNHEDRDDELAEFGKNKHKRSDCRQISFSLCSTADGIPLFHETHPGSTKDVKMFESMMDNWFDELPGPYTLVLDKGNNKKALFERVRKLGNHLVSNLKPSEHKDLVAVPLDKFEEETTTADDKVLKMYRTMKKVYGDTYTVVVTYSKSLYKRQHHYLQQTTDKQLTKVDEFLSTKLNTGKWTDPDVVETKLQSTLNYHDLKGCFEVSARRKRGRGMGRLAVEIERKEDRLQYLEDRCGKNLIFTDHHDWTSGTIAEVSHSRWVIEDDFRKVNCPRSISVRPMHVWTDGSIRAHHLIVFLTLQSQMLLHREVREAGLHLSYNKMLGRLRKVWEISFTVKKKRKKKRKDDTVYTLSKMDGDQKALVKLFDLVKYARD